MESTHVKMPHCWKSHALAQMETVFFGSNDLEKGHKMTLRKVTSTYRLLLGFLFKSSLTSLSQDLRCSFRVGFLFRLYFLHSYHGGRQRLREGTGQLCVFIFH